MLLNKLKNNKGLKRIGALALTLAMLVAAVPQAYAAEQATTQETTSTVVDAD